MIFSAKISWYMSLIFLCEPWLWCHWRCFRMNVNLTTDWSAVMLLLKMTPLLTCLDYLLLCALLAVCICNSLWLGCHNQAAFTLTQVRVYVCVRVILISDACTSGEFTVTHTSTNNGRTSQRGLGDCSPLTRAKLNFSGRSQQPKMKKIYIYLYLLNEKRNSFRLAR